MTSLSPAHSLAPSGRHLRQLCIDLLKTAQDLLKLALADLEHDLLVLYVTRLGLVLLQVHLHVEGWLFDAVLLLRRNFHVHAPVEVTHAGQRRELILQVHLRCFSDFTHHLEEERLDLLWESLRELLCQLVLVRHANCDVLLE